MQFYANRSQWQTVTRPHEKRHPPRLIRGDIVIKARSGTASSFRTKRYRAKSRVPFTRRNTVGHKSHHQTEGASAENPPPGDGRETTPGPGWWTLMPPFYQGGGRTKTCDASNMYRPRQQMEDFSFNYMWTRTDNEAFVAELKMLNFIAKGNFERVHFGIYVVPENEFIVHKKEICVLF